MTPLRLARVKIVKNDSNDNTYGIFEFMCQIDHYLVMVTDWPIVFFFEKNVRNNEKSLKRVMIKVRIKEYG